VIICIISQIFICKCILILSLSISNSGILNLISLGFSFLIDQIIVRLIFGFTIFSIFGLLYKN
jgi:hypothetical protein